jgi:hypothetical protein
MKRNWDDLSKLYRDYIAEHPSATISSIATQFDYTEIPKKITVGQREDYERDATEYEDTWLRCLDRARTAGGYNVAARGKMMHDSAFNFSVVVLDLRRWSREKDLFSLVQPSTDRDVA